MHRPDVEASSWVNGVVGKITDDGLDAGEIVSECRWGKNQIRFGSSSSKYFSYFTP